MEKPEYKTSVGVKSYSAPDGVTSRISQINSELCHVTLVVEAGDNGCK
jgi:hypothetical protein